MPNQTVVGVFAPFSWNRHHELHVQVRHGGMEAYANIHLEDQFPLGGTPL